MNSPIFESETLAVYWLSPNTCGVYKIEHWKKLDRWCAVSGSGFRFWKPDGWYEWYELNFRV